MLFISSKKIDPNCNNIGPYSTSASYSDFDHVNFSNQFQFNSEKQSNKWRLY